MTANGLVELMEDWSGCGQIFGGPEDLLNGPKLLVTKHLIQRLELGVGAQHEDAIELRIVLNFGSIDGKVVFPDRLEIATVTGIANQRLVALGELAL
jgi:hypothetical protein